LLVTIIGFHLLVIEVPTFSSPALGTVSVAGLPGKEVYKSVQLQSGIEDGKVTVIRASGVGAARDDALLRKLCHPFRRLSCRTFP
jgi:hypothetical protein